MSHLYFKIEKNYLYDYGKKITQNRFYLNFVIKVHYDNRLILNSLNNICRGTIHFAFCKEQFPYYKP